jgi:hypothetical protein
MDVNDIKMPQYVLPYATATTNYVKSSLRYHIHGPFEVEQEGDAFFIFVEDEDNLDNTLLTALRDGKYYYNPDYPTRFWFFHRYTDM